MEFDRRSLLAAIVLTTSACARANGETDEQRETSRKSLSSASDWQAFSAVYLRPDGRIVDNGNGAISHSEGQGYGMLLAEAAADRAAFDSMWGWTEKTLARSDVALYSWRYSPGEAVPVSDPNNATDGDILIAWALLRAHARWRQPEHMARAREIATTIRTKLIHRQAGRSLLLPALTGFVRPDRTTINPCYYIWPAIDLFRRIDPSDAWEALARDGERLARDARFGPSRLPCDWVDVTATGVVLPAADKPPRFGFDAIRIPLYQLAGNRRSLATEVVSYWRQLIERKTMIPAWIDVVSGERAPYALSPGGTAMVGHLLHASDMVPASLPVLGSDYYSDVLTLLSRLLLPGKTGR
ncbi:endoglucanase [Polymorphobacter multimanifer]|uniref:Glucanase n=1 Tax=Polymorphobacter multimanifer TaxID=1070431 RepID=A0A841LGH3_9SPHN|nr:glycosyl hydrolase family 8 [Polymorphobacter multimanifer]MBB6228068.1 endoglucanase [Polymorphobacter multimanifer]GGI74085.1 endoglucanase [Polymorphobacter multimanifer]